MSSELKWTDELVAKFWDEVAKSHLDSLSFAKVAGERFFELISMHFSLHGKILDFGAGSGDFTEILLKKGYQVAVYEPSVKRKEVLLSRLSKYDNFLGVVDNSSCEQFDVVMLLEVIEHILDDVFESTLKRVKSFLKQEGLLVVSTPNYENVASQTVYCPVSDMFFHPWQHVRGFSPEKLVKLLQNYKVDKQFLVLADFSENEQLYMKLDLLENRFRDNCPTLSVSSKSSNCSTNKLIGNRFMHRFFFWLFDKLCFRFSRDELMLMMFKSYRRLLDMEDRLKQSQGGALVDRQLGNGSTIIFVGKNEGN